MDKRIPMKTAVRRSKVLLREALEFMNGTRRGEDGPSEDHRIAYMLVSRAHELLKVAKEARHG